MNDMHEGGCEIVRMWIMAIPKIDCPQGLRRLVGGRVVRYFNPLEAESYESKNANRCVFM